MADDNSVLARARRARPRKTVSIGDDKYLVRMPNVAALREFQRLQRDGKSDEAVNALFCECVLEDDAVTTITPEVATELIGSPWVSKDLVTAILELAGVNVPAEGADAAAGDTAEKESDAG